MRSLAIVLFGTTALLTPAAVAQERDAERSDRAAGAEAGRQLKASSLQNQAVHREDGREFGRISDLVRDTNNRVFAVVSREGDQRVLLPIKSLAFDKNRYVVRGDEAQLQSLTNYRPGDGNYSSVPASERISLAGGAQSQRTAAAGDGSRIVVRQPAPAIRFDQAAPEIDVQQPPPQVSVRQGQPEIFVRQPAPTVTLDIPQPEITLRMPRPEVNVAQAQPQVDVEQPQPQVKLVRPPQKAQVDVEREEPQVTIQQPANTKSRVQVHGSSQQPRVRYERAEPRIVINEPEGEPTVRIEQAQERQSPQRTADDQAGQRPGQGGADERRRAYEQRFGAAGGTPESPDQKEAPSRTFSVADIGEMDVYNGRGELLGEIERVIESSDDNQQYFVVAHGGFLGLGEEKVAFSKDRFTVNGDRLVIRGVTARDIDTMDAWRDQVANYRDLSDGEQVQLATAQ